MVFGEAIFGEGSFRNRAASLLPSTHGSLRYPHRRFSNAEKASTNFDQLSETQWNEKGSREKENAESYQIYENYLPGTGYHSSGNDAVAHDRDAQRIVRTIPSWVHTLDEDDDDLTVDQEALSAPADAHIAHANTASTQFMGHHGTFRQAHPPRGRLHDHAREWTPPFPRTSHLETGSRWRAFATSSAYPIIPADLEREIVTEEWLAENGADYSRPWLASIDGGDPENGPSNIFRSTLKQRAWYERLERTILRSPIVPMVIRMVVLGFSAVALALAASIHYLTDHTPNADSVPSTNMAIIVDAVAIVYLLYITYDEYSGKPLGLRPAAAKMRLIFLDLFFIVFDSANLSLAFEAIPVCHTEAAICQRQKALASVLLIALVAWLLTFSISVVRLMERVHG